MNKVPNDQNEIINETLNERRFQSDLILKMNDFGFQTYQTENSEFLKSAFCQKLLFKNLTRRYPDISNNELEEISNQINIKLSNDWYKNNKVGLLNILVEGISTPLTINKLFPPYKLIDFDNIDTNDFYVTEEVNIAIGSRVDVAILINGLPVHLFELKSFFKFDDETDVDSAISQIGRYSTENPKFFTFQISSIAMNAFSNAVVGYPSLPKEFWFQIVPKYKDKDFLKTFEDFFTKEKLLKYIRTGILFEKNPILKKKYIFRHHQMEAIDAIVKNVKLNKGGLIWHTQGSGKTITMAGLISTLLRTKGFSSFTTIIDVDRVDLAKNIFEVISKIDEAHFGETNIKLAKDGNDLKNFLENKKFRGVIVTTTHKFKEWGLISNRSDILIVSDEAHRTHGEQDIIDEESFNKKTYLEKIREALPNSIAIGFTGTPIFEDDKSTTKQFGEILHIYNMKQAEDDEIITKIKYSFVHIPPTMVENESTNELSNSYGKIKNPRDIIDLHPERNLIICGEIIKKYKDAKFDHELKGNADSFKIMIATNQVKQGFEFLNILRNSQFLSDDEIQFVASKQDASKSADVFNYLQNQDNEKIYEEFKTPNSNIKVLIVTSMLLTGYDVPNLRLMFIDKQIEKHNLLQAVARTNRKFEGKTEGFVIMFRDLRIELEDALQTYRNTTGDNSSDLIMQTDFEKFISEKIVQLEENGIVIETGTKNLSFHINELLIKIKNLPLANYKAISQLLSDVANSIALVFKWESAAIKFKANLIRVIYINLNRREYESSLISINSEDFKKIIDSIHFDPKEVFYSIEDKTVEEIFKFTNSSKNSLIEIVGKKIKKAISLNNSFTSEEKKSVIEQIKDIIAKYNLGQISYEDVVTKFEGFEQDSHAYNNLTDYTRKLISILKTELEVALETKSESISKINNWFLSVDLENDLKTENSKKDFKKSFREHIIETFGISIAQSSKIVNAFINNYT